MKHAIIFGLLALFSLPAQAETQDDVLRGNLLPGWQMNNGHRMVGLNLQLAPQWKTYWRAPGEAGIPPVFDWSASTNVQSVRLHWPVPQVITLNGMQSIGYFNRLVLPVEITPKDPSQPVTLNLRMQLGICHEICMPAALDLTADLQGEGAQDPVIAAAIADAPMTAEKAGVTKVSCAVTPIEDGIRVEAQVALPVQGDPETVVIETEDPGVWVSEATSFRRDKVLNAVTELVPESGVPFALDRSSLIVTVIGQGRSVEIRGCPAP